MTIITLKKKRKIMNKKKLDTSPQKKSKFQTTISRLRPEVWEQREK
jgi:hypothetical protein